MGYDLYDFLELMVTEKASDLHLHVGAPPSLRVDGGVSAVDGPDLTPEDMQTAREVTFAPPRIRDYRQWEMGYELFEIIHMK